MAIICKGRQFTKTCPARPMNWFPCVQLGKCCQNMIEIIPNTWPPLATQYSKLLMASRKGSILLNWIQDSDSMLLPHLTFRLNLIYSWIHVSFHLMFAKLGSTWISSPDHIEQKAFSQTLNNKQVICQKERINSESLVHTHHFNWKLKSRSRQKFIFFSTVTSLNESMFNVEVKEKLMRWVNRLSQSISVLGSTHVKNYFIFDIFPCNSLLFSVKLKTLYIW